MVDKRHSEEQNKEVDRTAAAVGVVEQVGDVQS